MKPTALITGGGGFVGRHLRPMLEAAGYAISVVDPLAKGPEDWKMKFEEYSEIVKSSDREPDVFIHLAANILPIDKRMAGGLYNYQDIALDWAVAKWVEEFPPKKAFIYLSSCAVDTPEDPYAWVKLTGERLFSKVHDYGLPLVILRPFSGYGIDQDANYPFPAILSRIMRGNDPVEIWGSGYQVRDWIHVDDLARAIVWAIDGAPRSSVPIDIGTGIGTSLRKLALLILEEAFPDHNIGVRYDRDKPDSGMRRIADTTLASRYGYAAKITLGAGIRAAVEEWKERSVPS